MCTVTPKTRRHPRGLVRSLTRSVPDVAGVYRITCQPTGDTYVGSAVSVRRRVYGHLLMADSGRHPSRKLVELVRRHGVAAFAFEMLERCSVADLDARERHWFDLLNPTLCSLPPRGTNRPGRRKPVRRLAAVPSLRQRRLAKGWTQFELGQRVGRTATSVCEWEAGQCIPEAEIIPKLARALGIPPLELTKVISPDQPATAHPGV
jgi:DNA-binding XRE family transcriptional regulator